MALSLFTGNVVMSNDADFRAFVTAYRAALTAAGLVRTADTGQIDPTTVTKPTGTSVAAGYEIWRFADAAQATLPLFFKLEYGTGSASATAIGMWFTLGKGSDGAGNLTGVLMGRQQMRATSNPASQVQDTFVAAGDGYVSSIVHAGAPNYQYQWLLERLRLGDGSVDTTALGAGIMFHWAGNTQLLQCQSYDGLWNDAATGSSVTMPGIGPTTLTTSLYRGSVYAFPVYPCVGYPRGASRACISALSGDVSSPSPFTVQLYGTAHLFRTSGLVGQYYGRNTNATLGLRYE